MRDRHWHSADGTGVIYVAAKSTTLPILKKAAEDVGVSFTAVTDKPAGGMLKLRPVRIALWDQYGGSMPSGWVRYLFEKFEFPFTLVFPQELDAGNLRAKYDVIVFPDGAIREGGRGGSSAASRSRRRFRPSGGTVSARSRPTRRSRS